MPRKIIYKVTYPNAKIYVGKDLTDSINYFGSASSALIAKDFTRAERECFTIRREVLWESETATDREVNAKEVGFILELKSNDPAIGYNRWPRHRKSAGSPRLSNVSKSPQEALVPLAPATRWLEFSAPSNDATRVSLATIAGDTPKAATLARDLITPSVLAKAPVVLDFSGLELCTQSFLHALLFEPVRLAWALRVPIHIVHADPAVAEGLRFLEAYALGG